jgi:hypothetical protein
MKLRVRNNWENYEWSLDGSDDVTDVVIREVDVL